MRYIVMNSGPNRAERRKSRHNAVDNRDGRRKAHRMNRPERMDVVNNGTMKLRDFFGIR